MLKVTFTITGVTPLCYGAAAQSTRNTGESHEAYDERVWRERMHKDSQGNVFIPPNAMKNTIVETAKFLSESVPGKGKATYTKNFLVGLIITDPIYIGLKEKDIKKLRLFVPADGKTGGSTRVWRNFPLAETWSGNVEIMVVDPMLIDKPEKIEEYLIHAGKMIGLLTFRPRKGGQYGRFTVSNFKAVKQ